MQQDHLLMRTCSAIPSAPCMCTSMIICDVALTVLYHVAVAQRLTCAGMYPSTNTVEACKLSRASRNYATTTLEAFGLTSMKSRSHKAQKSLILQEPAPTLLALCPCRGLDACQDGLLLQHVLAHATGVERFGIPWFRIPAPIQWCSLGSRARAKPMPILDRPGP